MDIDGLLRACTVSGTRRTILAALGGIGLAGAGTIEPAQGKKKKKRCRSTQIKCGKKCCVSGQTCCGNVCITADRCCANGVPDACNAGQTCSGGTCGCPSAACSQATNPIDPQKGCFCDTATGIGAVCMAEISCTGSTPCSANGGCPSGQVCQTLGCGNNPTCVPVCALS
ncbi:MAG: hypothetical protein U0031_19565 [Thermomicrobiales bacterium]